MSVMRSGKYSRRSPSSIVIAVFLYSSAPRTVCSLANPLRAEPPSYIFDAIPQWLAPYLLIDTSTAAHNIFDLSFYRLRAFAIAQLLHGSWLRNSSQLFLLNSSVRLLSVFLINSIVFVSMMILFGSIF